ncbi:endolytic transglycosylase MltG [Pseudarthrobacter sp. S9]|uniref:endolytic transglycosylase MltG n=1 Tax=Pseudarthrobacter sp. S9 TaxID=3418421 RepID=UPI003D04B117
MSPVNSDDSSGDAFSGAGRPLTRKELRAQEKLLATQGHDVIPPQAFETGQHFPTAEPTAAPELPEAAPTVHEEAVHEEAVREQAAAAPEAPLETFATHPAEEHFVHAAAPGERISGYAGPADPHVQAARGNAAEHHQDSLHSGFALHGSDLHESDLHESELHESELHGAEPHPEDEAHHVYADADVHAGMHVTGDYHGETGHELMAGAVRTAKGPSKKVRRRRRFLALVLSLTVFVVAIVVGAQFIKPFLGGDAVADYPGPGTGDVAITVAPGAGPKSVATELQDKKVVANADTFLKEFAASGGALSPGSFTMRKEMKNSDAVAILLNKDKGKVMYFALSAGLRISESLQAISEGTGISMPDLKALNDAPAQFGVPAKAKNLEGFLAPGEYRFPLGTPAKDILQKLVGSTLDELKAQGVTDPAKQYDAVTVASIVQAEGGQAEYGDVAGAILNRLKPNNTETNGLIQSDATVTYGLGIRSFHIDEAQKADKSNPYNTYASPGLPAGPIGSPGKTAIDAAAKPKANDYLYWVTINLDTKETKFSKTLAEHNGYVAKYNAWCDANPGRCV